LLCGQEDSGIDSSKWELDEENATGNEDEGVANENGDAASNNDEEVAWGTDDEDGNKDQEDSEAEAWFSIFLFPYLWAMPWILSTIYA